MADGLDFDVDEINRLAVALPAASVAAMTAGNRVVRATALRVVATAQQLVPVDTSATKNSIHATFPGLLEAEIGPTTEYAPYLEFGTTKMAPYAFMGPALDRETPGFVEAASKIAELLR